MKMQEQISSKLSEALSPEFIEVINESHLHNTPVDSESHFKVIIVCQAFNGKLPVKRHQLVYGILADELSSQVHALALHTYTPEEWSDRHQQAPASPDCRGGSKKVV